jgi:hypothetical protein
VQFNDENAAMTSERENASVASPFAIAVKWSRKAVESNVVLSLSTAIRERSPVDGEIKNLRNMR